MLVETDRRRRQVTNRYAPDYAVSPGAVLEERLAAHDISHAEFARRCGRSAKLIGEIIAGQAPVEPETALRFEKVLGVAADIWLGIEKDYRTHRRRAAEAGKAAAAYGASPAEPAERSENPTAVDGGMKAGRRAP